MQIEASTVNAVVVMLFTLWLIGARFAIAPQSNWPLIYYLVLVVFHLASYNLFSPFPIYLAVVCALFLRFEFLSKGFRTLFRGVEFAALVYIFITLVGAVGIQI